MTVCMAYVGEEGRYMVSDGLISVGDVSLFGGAKYCGDASKAFLATAGEAGLCALVDVNFMSNLQDYEPAEEDFEQVLVDSVLSVLEDVPKKRAFQSILLTGSGLYILPSREDMTYIRAQEPGVAAIGSGAEASLSAFHALTPYIPNIEARLRAAVEAAGRILFSVGGDTFLAKLEPPKRKRRSR